MITITLTQSAKASIREMYFQRPDLSARDIATFLKLNRRQTLEYMKQLGYTKEKHLAAVNTRKEKMEQAKQKDKLPQPIPVIQPTTSTGNSPYYAEKRMEAKLKKQVETADKLMMQAAEDGDIESYIQHRKDYDAAQRRLAAYRERGTLTAEDKTIYKAENQYAPIN